MFLQKSKLGMLMLLLFFAACAVPVTEGLNHPAAVQDFPATDEMFAIETELPAVEENNPVEPATPATPIVIANSPQNAAGGSVPLPERPTYTLRATYDYDAHTVDVDETISYPNRSRQPLQKLVLAVSPNSWSDCFRLNSLFVNGEKNEGYMLNGRRMEIPLPSALLPGQAVRISLQYNLNLPFIEDVDPTVAGPRIFGYTSRQQNLTNWYPFVVPFIEGEWVLHEPAYQGEFLLYDAADFDIYLKFADPNSAPVVAASGYLEAGPNADGAHYTLRSGRSFVLSASREYLMEYAQTGNIFVYSYYFSPGAHEGRAVLKAVIKAIEIYGEKFGPYPHQTMSVVMGDFRGSMEHSALFFHGYTAYKLYDGTANNEFISIAVHETAHQWWFDQIGSDPALTPWLDESLSTYSEHIYYEKVSPASVEKWWWPFRVDLYEPAGNVDITIYDLAAYRPYVNSVYLQGAHFLEELRSCIGEDAFFSFLREYYALYQGTIVNADGFWNLLGKHTDADIYDLVRKYFRNAPANNGG